MGRLKNYYNCDTMVVNAKKLEVVVGEADGMVHDELKRPDYFNGRMGT